MSLLDKYYEDFVLMTKTVQDDGYGGYTTVYTEGITVKAALRIDQSTQARIAEKEGVTNLYTIITPKALNLQYHDVIKRKADNQIFRVTSDGNDNKTPTSAGLDMRAVSAEKWALPT